MIDSKKLKTGLMAIVMAGLLSSTAQATPFQPVMDEFWIVKNGSELFRDSFNDGFLPPTGPDGATTYFNSAQAGLGGMTTETGGKLTITPSLGAQTLITGTSADTFTGGTRANRGGLNSLSISDSVEIHGLFDLSSLPTITGQQFGIRFTDRDSNNTGDDIIQLSVVKSGVSGDIGVRFAELDFVADTSETAGFMSISSLLPSAFQIELILTKAAGSNIIEASYNLVDSFNVSVGGGALDNINNVTLSALSIYNGEGYTRGQFFATDTNVPVPEPGVLGSMLVGLVGLGLARWKLAA